MTDNFRVGVISSSHGVRGEVKVYPTTDDIERFDLLSSVMVDTNKGIETLNIESVRYAKGMVLIKFKEFSSIDDMMPYKGCDLLVSREDALPLREGEYYISDLIGLDAIEDTGRELGSLTDVLQTGANDVYIIKSPEGKEYLIPAIKDCIKSISLEENRIVIHMIKGLAEL